MKLTLVFITLAVVTVAGISLQPRPKSYPPNSLKADFKQFEALIPKDRLKNLFWRYIIHDAQFQAIVRYVTSAQGSHARHLLHQQPEVLDLVLWTSTQLSLDSSESSESSEEICFTKNAGYLSLPNSPLTAGWDGFASEFIRIYPSTALQLLTDRKLAQNGIFTQFYNKLQAVRPGYERVLLTEDLQAFIGNLTELGVNVTQVDQFIRQSNGWN